MIYPHLFDIEANHLPNVLYAFKSYVFTYFVKDFSGDKYSRDGEFQFLNNINHALKHNFDNLKKPESYEVSVNWIRLLNDPSLRLKGETTFASVWIRHVWENSNKSKELISVIQSVLNSCFSIETEHLFLTLIPDNFSALDSFYATTPEDIFKISLEAKKIEPEINKYIYSTRYVNKAENFEPDLKERYIHRLNNFVKHESFFNEFLTESKDQLQFLVAGIYICVKTMESTSSANNLVAYCVDLKEYLDQLIAKMFPTQKTQLDSILCLSTNLNPRELIAHLNTDFNVSAESLDLPLF